MVLYDRPIKTKRPRSELKQNKQSVFQTKIQVKEEKYTILLLLKRYPNASEEDFINACPVCCDNCNCTECLRQFLPQEYSCCKHDKIQYSKYILRKVFPLVKRMNEDQLTEKKIEAKYRGLSLSELQLKVAKLKVDERLNCDNCGADIFDFHRSCACGYDLCLVCCRDLRTGDLLWKSRIDGSIPCPPNDIGGCDDGILELKRIMPVDFVVNLLEKAHRLYEVNKSDDIPETSTEFCMCDSSYLYSPSAKDIQPQDLKHFQLHWSKGDPVIVRDVLSTSSGLSWEPMVLWRVFRDIKKSGKRSGPYQVNAIDCSDWSKVTVGFSKFCRGYSKGLSKRKGCPLLLKLEDWKPFCSFREEQPRHFVEFISCLPFKDYTDPQNGYLNVAVKLPDLSFKPDMGPRMDIAYGFEEEWDYGDSVTKLHYGTSDTVNVLTHKNSAFNTSTNLNKTHTVKRKHGDRDEALDCEEGLQTNKTQQSVGDPIEAGALWDIFRRQDIPKLEKYLRNHSADFKLSDGLTVDQDGKEHRESNSDNKVQETANDDNIEGEIEPESEDQIIDCPTPEFTDFYENITEKRFKARQIWACYDNEDGMPRDYVYIKKVVTPGFKLEIQWLKPDPGSPDEKEWVEADLPLSCGNFKRGKQHGKADDLLHFSHLVSTKAGPKVGPKAGTYNIVPRKGETWALFKNWSMNWRYDKKRKYEFEFVEILSDYDEKVGVRVSYLEKVKGFVCLFMRKEDGETVIPGSDNYKFSHKVPSCRMSGREREGVPKGSYELDPRALPLSTFKQVIHPLHDRNFYLNTEHKKKLKEEFGIEPWTFKQNLGDAVFIPAGCPYQIKNLKSNMKVELNLISPESLDECIRLQHEIRMLPDNHREKQEKLNIGKIMIFALDHALADLESNEPNDDLDFAKMPDILQGDNANICSHSNGWLSESSDSSPENSSDGDGLKQEEFGIISSSSPCTSKLSTSSLNVSPELKTTDPTVNHEPVAHQECDETVVLWRGDAVGHDAKELLQAVEQHYPNTFQGVQIPFKQIRLSTLKEFNETIKRFLETSVDKLTKEQITSLREDLNDFKTFGFDLSWVDKRVDMVETLKFGNDPLRQEFTVLKESLGPVKERIVERQKQLVEAREMMEMAQLEYENAKSARNNKAQEMVEKFGNEYDYVLKGKLGFGLVPSVAKP